MTTEEAREEAARIVALVRERGFKTSEGSAKFTDAQIWQAILDSRDYGGHVWDNAAVKLIEHAIESKVPPSAPQYPGAES